MDSRGAVIEVYPDYFVNERGELFSAKSNRWLKPQEYVAGYWSYALRLNGKTCNKLAHRLVAASFLPNELGLPLVCHKDDDPSNNHVDNLYWGTKSSNLVDAYRNGKKTLTAGQKLKMREGKCQKYLSRT
jgi:hypothetical protein